MINLLKVLKDNYIRIVSLNSIFKFLNFYMIYYSLVAMIFFYYINNIYLIYK